MRSPEPVPLIVQLPVSVGLCSALYDECVSTSNKTGRDWTLYRLRLVNQLVVAESRPATVVIVRDPFSNGTARRSKTKARGYNPSQCAFHDLTIE
jgi:hypothetical protein